MSCPIMFSMFFIMLAGMHQCLLAPAGQQYTLCDMFIGAFMCIYAPLFSSGAEAKVSRHYFYMDRVSS